MHTSRASHLHILTLLGPWRSREAFARNCTRFTHLALLSGTLLTSCYHCHCAPSAARRGVYGCSAIRWWLWVMVGVIFHTRSSALAGREVVATEWSVRREVADAWNIRKYVTLGEYSTAAQHVPLPCRMVPPFRWYIIFLPSNACIAEVYLLGFTTFTSTALFANTTLHMASHATQFSHTRGRTHTKCMYPLCATMADSATSPQSRVPPCAHMTHHHRQRHGHFAIWRHWVVCTAWCAMGHTSARRYVLARGTFRWVLRCIPSYARALYAEIIPPGEEARWCDLFSITDKVCTCICPSERAIDRGCNSIRLLLTHSVVRSK